MVQLEPTGFHPVPNSLLNRRPKADVRRLGEGAHLGSHEGVERTHLRLVSSPAWRQGPAAAKNWMIRWEVT